MRQGILAIVVAALMAASLAAGYVGGSRVTSTKTITSTSTVVTTAATPTNGTICWGDCGNDGTTMTFDASSNLSATSANAPAAPLTCQNSAPKSESYLELAFSNGSGGGTVGVYRVTMWFEGMTIMQNITTSCELSPEGPPLYIVETGLGSSNIRVGDPFVAVLYLSLDVAAPVTRVEFLGTFD